MTQRMASPRHPQGDIVSWSNTAESSIRACAPVMWGTALVPLRHCFKSFLEIAP
jgi:hypothetical protein